MHETLRRYGLVLVGTLLATKIACAAFLSLGMTLNTPHRMFNVRTLKDEVLRYGFVEIHLREFLASPGRHILFVGDSFMYGYSWPESLIFTRVLAGRLDAHISNASIIGISHVQEVLAILDRIDRKPDTIVFNTTLANLKEGGLQPILQPQPRELARFPGLFRFVYFLRNAPGFEGLEFLRDPYARATREREFQLGELKENFFDISRGRIEQVRKAFAPALRNSRHVVFFVSPVPREGIERAGLDVARFSRDVASVNALCEDFPAVHCLDPMFRFPLDDFYDISHLNLRGHRAFAAWLEPELTGRLEE